MQRLEPFGVTDKQAIDACKWCAQKEGIIPALETAHALALLKQPHVFKPKSRVVLCLSGRGDKDMETIAKHVK